MMRFLFLGALFLLLTSFGGSVVGQQELVIKGAQVKLIRNMRVPVREPGILIKLNVKMGDTVTAGQVIGEMDDDLFKLNQQISKLEFDHAELSSTNNVNKLFADASQKVSSAVVRRSEAAIARFEKSVSTTELEKAALEAERDGLASKQAELELQLAKIQKDLKSKELNVSQRKLNYRTISAPFNGVVAETFPQEGEWLNAGEPVLRLIQLDKLHVEARVDARKYDSSLLGKKVSFTAELLPESHSETFEGVIDFVSLEIEPLSEEITILAEIDNRMQTLRPGTRGELKIKLKP